MVDITKMEAKDFRKELPEIVHSLDALRAGDSSHKPVEVTFE